MHVPPGFNTVTPYVFIEGAARFMEFLVQGLGGIEILRHMNGDRIANDQVRIGTSTLMVSEASTAFPAMPYGDRQGGIKDPCGNIWWLSQRLIPGPY